MAGLIQIIEDKNFENSFYNKIESLFAHLIVDGKITPFIIEYDKREVVVKNGRYKRDENNKLAKKIIKGISLTTKDEWERKHGKIREKDNHTSIFLKKNLLVFDEASNNKYNMKLEWDILQENKRDFRTIKEYFHLEKLGSNFNLHKIKIDSGIDDFGMFKNRAIVPYEMVPTRIVMNFEQDIRFEKGKNPLEGGRGLSFALRGYLKIEGDKNNLKDNLIKKVYEAVKNE